MTDIIFYGFQFPHHGQFSAFSALSNEFARQDISVCQAKLMKPPAWLPGRISGNLASSWMQFNEYRLRKAFKMGNTVHYFFPENSLFKAVAWKKTSRLILSCHQPIEQLLIFKKNGMLKPFFEGLKTAEDVILMASCDIDAYRKLAPNSVVRYIPHGVDVDFFCPNKEPFNSNERYRILTIGNWLRDYTLWGKVVDRVVSECPDVEFSVLANSDGLSKAMSNLQIGRNHVRLLNNISDTMLRHEYCRADVIFLPLVNAWANNALLEGMSCGRPVVVTDLPATREYAGDSALYINKGCVDSAVETLFMLIGNRALGIKMGQTARKRIESNFSWRQVVQQYMNLYANVHT